MIHVKLQAPARIAQYVTLLILHFLRDLSSSLSISAAVMCKCLSFI